tara:strand:- start:103 stop:924 length:822 start_codon:yes stop_codon:yes gene_type:complete
MIAFIETPLQIVSINHLKLGYEIKKTYLISRKNWHVNTKQILDQNNQIKEINIFSAFIICLVNSIQGKDILIGSHLGRANKILINTANFFKRNIVVLDDGNYSLKSPEWLLKKIKKNNIIWYSSYFDNNEMINGLRPYCLFSYKFENYYENKAFILLPDFEGIGVSLEQEKMLLLKIKKKLKGKDIYLFPHRRGRKHLYQELDLRPTKKNELCFEEWYAKSDFKNCCLYGAPSSAFSILRDKRMKIFLIKNESLIFHKNESHIYKKLDGEFHV